MAFYSVVFCVFLLSLFNFMSSRVFLKLAKYVAQLDVHKIH